MLICYFERTHLEELSSFHIADPHTTLFLLSFSVCFRRLPVRTPPSFSAWEMVLSVSGGRWRVAATPRREPALPHTRTVRGDHEGSERRLL